MAWYALYKWFIPWRKTPYINWIIRYKRHLYDEWFDNLPEDEQKAELERQKMIREKRKRDGQNALATLIGMNAILNRYTHDSISSYSDFINDFYSEI